MKRLLLATAALFAAPLQAETVAITGATIATGEEVAPSQGNVVITNGRVTAVGNVAVPAGARVIDGTGKWVSPGVFAGFTRLGLVGVDAVDETNDASARNTPFSASLDASTAINPRVPAIAVREVGT